MKLTPTKVFNKNLTAILQGYRYVLNQGSTRSGKTYSALQIGLLTALAQPNRRVIVIAVTRNIAEVNLLNDFKEILGDDWRKFGTWMQSKLTYFANNGSEVMLVSAEKPDNYHGVKSYAIVLDEPNIWKKPDKLIEQVASRCDGFLILCLNPSRQLDWLDELNERDDTKYIHSTYLDNLENISKKVVKEIEERAKRDPQYEMIYKKGLYAVDKDRVIFTNWHVTDFFPSLEDSKKQMYGLDLGFLHDPTVLIDLRIYDGQVYLKEKFRALNEDASTDEIVKVLMTLPRGCTVVVDSSEPRTVSAIKKKLKDKGHLINLVKVRKPKGSKVADIKTLREDYIINIHSDDVKLKREFEGYQKKEVAGNILDEPKDGNDDGIDAMIYAFRQINKSSLKVRT